MDKGSLTGSRKGFGTITKSLVLASTGVTKSRSQTLDAYLAHITHLHLQSKRLKAIENLDACTNLKVLYLYDNKIEEIDHLEFAKGLTYLYLENNCIKTIPDLVNPKLKKLFLDENEISVIRGLDQCSELVVLSVARQRIPRMTSVSFDLRSLDVISRTLQVLDISGCGITSLVPFRQLYSLQKLFGSDNNISDIGEIEGIVGLPHLEEVNFKRNPCSSLRRYRDFVIGASSNALRLFDDVPVTPRHIEAVKGIQRRRRKLGLVAERSTDGCGSSGQYDERYDADSRQEGDVNYHASGRNHLDENQSGGGGSEEGFPEGMVHSEYTLAEY
jgi:Leucine-rich repeat (LRR) protein